MIKFELIDGDITHEYGFPESASEITLRKFIDYMNGIELSKPETLKAYEAAKTPEEAEEIIAGISIEEIVDVWNDFYIDFVVYWTGMPEEYASYLTREQMAAIYKAVILCIYNVHINKEATGFTFAGVEYHFPPAPENIITGAKEHMKGTQFIDTVEAFQFEKYSAQLGKSEWSALPYLIAVLCKKEGERLPVKSTDREEFIGRRAKMFYDLPLNEALSLSFFLSKRKQHFKTVSVLYSLLRQISEEKAILKFGIHTVGSQPSQQ